MTAWLRGHLDVAPSVTLYAFTAPPRRSRVRTSARKRKDLAISTPSIARSTATMSTATALSRVTGFVRMWATALALGATPLMASYSVANNLPNMVFELVAGGILSSLFIPTLMEVKAERGEEAAWRFTSHVFNLSILSLGVIAIVGTVLPQPFIWTQTFRLPPGESEGVVRAAEFFFRFFAVQVVVYGAGMVIQGVLNSRRQYLWPALGPVFNNVVVIATMISVYVMGVATPTGLVVLAVGTTLGVLAMFAVMVPSLVKGGVRYTPELGLSDPAVRRMLVLAVPTIIYVVTNLVAVSFRNASAFAVAENGPSILMYAWTFYQLPYGILAVALATAVFTELSEASGRKDTLAFKAHFLSGLRMTGVLMLPASAVLIALAEPLVSLYRVGNFQQSDVAPVASALRWWALGLVFFAAMMFVLRAFYSLKDTLTPALANIGASAVQIGLYVLLTTGFGAWAGLGINGIPISDVIFYALLLAILSLLMRRKIGGYDLGGVVSAYGRMAIASIAGGIAAYATASLLGNYVTGLTGVAVEIVAGTAVCLMIALGLGRAMGVSEAAAATAFIGKVGRRLGPRRKR